jgi:peptidoglycan hydrolase CwlO-like protein
VQRSRRPTGRVPKFINLRIVISASVTVAVVLVTAVGASADPTIPEKRAQAQAIMAEVQQLDSDLAKSIEEYNFAAIELDQIDTEIITNGRHLVAARKSLGVAQQRVAQRLRDLYINGSGTPRWRSSSERAAWMRSSLGSMPSKECPARTG